MKEPAETVAQKELRVLPEPQRPADSETGEQHREVKVLFTGETQTRIALESAARLAGRSHARLSLLYLQVVPRPLPPDCSPVPIEFLQERMHKLASWVDAEIEVHIYLCRDKREALRRVLKPPALIVIGDKKSWWPSKARRLGKELERLGHKVIYIERSASCWIWLI